MIASTLRDDLPAWSVTVAALAVLSAGVFTAVTQPSPTERTAPATQGQVARGTCPETTPSALPQAKPPSFARSFTVLRSSGFSPGFAEWDLNGPSVHPGPGSDVEISRSGYGDSSAGRASIPGGRGNKWARTLWGNTRGEPGALDLGEGADFTYGMALYLPRGFYRNMQAYFVPMRWDTFGTANVSRGGLSMFADGSLRLFREREGVERQMNLLGDTTFRLEEGSWHWLEVRQRLSSRDGKALNELHVDGRKIGASAVANYYGDPVAAVRYGIVAIDGGRQTRPLTVLYDRAVLGRGRAGPGDVTASGPSVSLCHPEQLPARAPAASGRTTEPPLTSRPLGVGRTRP